MNRNTFWVGGRYVPGPTGQTITGQLFVEHLAPQTKAGDQPSIVLVHGGGGQGLDYLATPDGRPGWAPLLAARGHDVYVVDRVGHGRSPYDPTTLGEHLPTMGAEVLAALFFPPADGPGSHPTSGLHTQWPGGRGLADGAVRQFLASQGPLIADSEAAQQLDQAGLVALLEQIGPAVVIAHSAGAPAAFLAADRCPEQVLALVACEPLGPPFAGAPGLPLAWGVTNAPITYEPPVTAPTQITPGSARRLVNLAQTPILLVTAEASPLRWIADDMQDFLQDAGCWVDHIRLWEHGIHGNSHGFMFELNNGEVLDLILQRLAQASYDRAANR